jgi:hypothetical protein
MRRGMLFSIILIAFMLVDAMRTLKVVFGWVLIWDSIRRIVLGLILVGIRFGVRVMGCEIWKNDIYIWHPW